MNVELVLAVLVAVTAGLGQAQGSGPEGRPEPGSAADPGGVAGATQPWMGTAIPYAGHLTDEAGQPVVEGTYDFSFTLYAAESGGAPLWSEAQKGVTVTGGSFSVSLGSINPIPPGVLSGRTLWLAAAVLGPGEAGFTPLTPRQRVSAAAPAAARQSAACPHDHFMEDWTGDGSAEAYGLRIENTGFGDAIRAYSNIGNAVWASSAAAGSYSGYFVNTAAGGAGLYARSGSNAAADLVLGANNSTDDDGRLYSSQVYPGTDLLLVSNDAIQLDLDNDSDEDGHFWILNGANTTVFSVNESGDMIAIGTKSAAVTTQGYGQRKLYAVESPEVWFEDFGRAKLVDGAATVAVEPVFAQTVNLEAYHVYLTAVCREPVLLFVAQQTPAAFTVQGVTLGGQPSQCAFDYRLVAKRLGYEKVRLEPAETDLHTEGDAP